MLLICLFLASEARRVILTLLGLDGMGLDMMTSMVKLLFRYSQYHTKRKPPKVNSKELPQCMYVYMIIRGRKLASDRCT